MKPLLVATTNPAKLEEYRLLLREHGLEPLSLAQAGVDNHTPAEDGATFAENALHKARFYFVRAGMPTLADDGGLEVDALGGEPGVRSHRWLEGSVDATGDDLDCALAEEVIRRMQGVALRSARIRAAVALVSNSHGSISERLSEAAIEGVIADRVWPRMRAGFPFRAVLFLPKHGCYLAELPDHEAARLSQRRVALEGLRSELALVAGSR